MPDPGQSSTPPAVELRKIDKSFYGVLANADVDFSLARGEVHALLGENGAGKSTLCSVIAGLYRPDSGDMLMDGEVVALKSPKDALAAGIGMVYQHFRLVSNLTVAENLALGNPEVGLRLSQSELEAEAEHTVLAVAPAEGGAVGDGRERVVEPRAHGHAVSERRDHSRRRAVQQVSVPALPLGRVTPAARK